MSAERQNNRLQQVAPEGSAFSTASRKPRSRRLTACFAAAFALAPAAVPATPLIVSNCNDSGSGSLRAQIGAASSGDTIDLSTTQLTCSLITLTSGEIAFSKPYLTLIGPASRTVTITTNANNRLLHETYFSGSSGVLDVQNLTLSGGYYHSTAGNAVGGCIASYASVKLTASVVSGCEAYSYSGYFARGGGIWSFNAVLLYNSRIIGNTAYDFNNKATGGGIFAGLGFTSSYSTISANQVRGGAEGSGGGVYAIGSAMLNNSTIDSNVAQSGAGIAVAFNFLYDSIHVLNSTISGNQASGDVGGLRANIYYELSIQNSTIAFNTAAHYAGVFVNAKKTFIQSSILARNTNSQGGSADLFESGGYWSTSHSLVQSFSPTPTSGTVSLTADPQLAPLANHGGPTRTHALLATSPAIDQGDALTFSTDQRGTGFPRVVGIGADIGAYERQANDDEIFYSGFN